MALTVPRPLVTRVRKVAVFLFANLVIFGVSEAVLRGAFDPRFAPRTDFEVPNAETVYAIAPGLGGRYYSRDFSMTITTDAFGNRLSSLGEPGADDRLVLVVGDSYTFGWGVQTDETFAADLDHRLAKLTPPLRAVNLGVPGYGTLAMAAHLGAFLREIDPRRVSAIVVLHADNDPSDNVDFLLFHNGVRVRVFRHSPHSQLRLRNLVTAAFQPSAPKQMPSLPGGRHRRLAWRGMDFGSPDEVNVNREADVRATKKSEQLTPLQSQLMKVGIDAINGTCAGCGIPIHHIILNLGDHADRYNEALSKPFVDMHEHGNRVRFHGVARLHHDDTIPAHNGHSGGHFTPAYNRAYGEFILECLLSEKLTNRSPP